MIAIAGIPGAGKTTLAQLLANETGWPLVSSGDIARRIDPGGVARGALADEAAFRDAWFVELRGRSFVNAIFDGIPRNRGQVELLPNGTTLIVLRCRPSTAFRRLQARGRADDQDEIIERRITEQVDLLEARRSDGWLYRLAGPRVFDTEELGPEVLCNAVASRLGWRDSQGRSIWRP